MGAHLCFMAVQLTEMHRVLRNDGSLYLHCDITANHCLKELLDAIFGYRNFRNEIIWSYQGTGEPKKHFKRKHEYLLFYAKTKFAFLAMSEVVNQ